GYLESKEYIERYGTSPVWSDYRRNQKGAIPPQKTCKTCIVDKICGNPHPICRDPNVIIHYQNVKLQQQFISPYTGVVYDPTWTGKMVSIYVMFLYSAYILSIFPGLLPFQVPHVDFTGEDYSNSYDSVGSAPPPPTMTPWYSKLKHRNSARNILLLLGLAFHE
uniref:Mitochondrial ribosomal protein S18B n=1 Tax=Salmo trutta TaxID=8032 RepID=A0A674DVX1_SALTR